MNWTPSLPLTIAHLTDDGNKEKVTAQNNPEKYLIFEQLVKERKAYASKLDDTRDMEHRAIGDCRQSQ
jgi:hypothetical protein